MNILFGNAEYELLSYQEVLVNGYLLLKVSTENIEQLKEAIEANSENGVIKILENGTQIEEYSGYNKIASLSLAKNAVIVKLVIQDKNYKERLQQSVLDILEDIKTLSTTISSLNSNIVKINTNVEEANKNISTMKTDAEKTISEIVSTQEALCEVFELVEALQVIDEDSEEVASEEDL